MTLVLAVVLALLVVDILWAIVGWLRGRGRPLPHDDAASRRRLLDELGRQP